MVKHWKSRGRLITQYCSKTIIARAAAVIKAENARAIAALFHYSGTSGRPTDSPSSREALLGSAAPPATLIKCTIWLLIIRTQGCGAPHFETLVLETRNGFGLLEVRKERSAAP